MSDPFESPEWKAYARHAVSEMKPKLVSSNFVVQIVPNEEGDVKFWTELGASIMFDKPIIAVVEGDAKLPSKLKLIADEIVRLPTGATEARRADLLQRAISRLMERP